MKNKLREFLKTGTRKTVMRGESGRYPNGEGWGHSWNEEVVEFSAKKLDAATLAAQGEAVAWRIDTDDDVERVAKAAGWNNRSYMTPADYAIWCIRMREFVRLAAGHAAPPASPAAKVIRAENGSCYIEWAAGANMLDYVGASLYTRPASPAGVPDEATDEFVPRWWDESHGDAYKEGWNDCRAALLAAAPSAPEGDGGAE